jgi:CheY-like chemotaxis protein
MSPPTILYLAADLLWASKIKGTADALAIPARPVRTLEMLEARLADTDAKALLLDLEKPDESLQMIARLRGPSATDRDRSIRLIAWGPHVAKDLLQQARTAGADEVLTRGAFDHNMQEILLALHARA